MGRGSSDQIPQTVTSSPPCFDGPLKSLTGEDPHPLPCTNAAPWTPHLQNVYLSASFLADNWLGVGQHPKPSLGDVRRGPPPSCRPHREGEQRYHSNRPAGACSTYKEDAASGGEGARPLRSSGAAGARKALHVFLARALGLGWA